jgi:hypothetical protein
LVDIFGQYFALYSLFVRYVFRGLSVSYLIHVSEKPSTSKTTWLSEML